MSKESVRSWSHAFLITYDKKLAEKLLAVGPEKVTRRKKKKKKTRTYAMKRNSCVVIKKI